MTEDQSRAKLHQAVRDLEHALSFCDKALSDRFFLAGIAKSFETCLEYLWKYCRRCALDAGLEVYAPKDAFKTAGRLGILDDVEAWIEFINFRNRAVHDYLGVPDEEYLRTVKQFFARVKELSFISS